MSGLAGQTSLFPPEPAPDPLLCWLWLAHVLGPASVHAGRVLDAFGGAQEAWEARDTAEFRLAAGEAAALRAQQLAPEQYHPLVMRCDDLGVRILPFDDPDYPLAFSRIPDMPLVLYCTGDPLWLNEPGAVGIVGSRKPTEYGLNAAADIGGELAQSGALIVSGLADGLDSAGHRAAVKDNCPTIAVMGVPIDRTYPAANVVLRHKIEQKGCVISEYPPAVRALAQMDFCSATGSLRRSALHCWWWKRRKKAAPCPPCLTPNAMASRCSRCQAASTRPIPQAQTAFCGTAERVLCVLLLTCLARWACAGRAQRR